MRPVLPGDLDFAVRALLPAPLAARGSVARAIIQTADIADRYRKRLGRAHPVFGDGSVGAAARRYPLAPLPDYCNARYCGALAVFLAALAGWRGRV